MHNGGVVQTLLNAQGQRQALSKSATLTIGSTGISCSQVTQGSFASTSAISRRGGEAERRDPPPPAAQPGFTDQFFIRRAVGQADGTQGIGLLSAQQQRVKILHLLDQAVSDGGDDDQAFFGDTGQVVIEGGAADDIFGGFDEIGGFINDARRIAGASADHFLPLFMPIATMPGPPVIARTAISGWDIICWVASKVGSATVTTRLRIPLQR
ncbi:Uncharacterised protein [Klebsiella pneumoniae]|uniref:Uncharacterized protein n=1 Tax=Klebsiella pneumoniae TaxID=573 RepID=A0A378BSF9_KLEPN|nr:Uncharacterised protein [Klebsiella pneumoniae]